MTATMMNHLRRYLFLTLCGTALCWSADYPRVKDVPIPKYPPLARMAQLEGAVTVEVEIGADGRVTSAKSTGGHAILQRAAEENARLWTFGVITNGGEFPIRHTIIFDYKIVGNRVAYPDCPQVVLHLPNSVEITSQPPLVNTSQAMRHWLE